MSKIRFSANFQWLPARASHQVSESDTNKVYYDPTVDGSIADFDRSTKGRTARSQYRLGIEKMQAFLRKNGASAEGSASAIRNLEYFGRKIEQGVDGEYSTALDSLYRSGKRAFDEIVNQIEGSDRTDLLVSAIVDMSLGLTVCAPGVASHLMMTDQRINSGTAGILGHAHDTWSTLFDSSLSPESVTSRG